MEEAKADSADHSGFDGPDAVEGESGQRQIRRADDDCREQTRAEKSRGGAGQTRECHRRTDAKGGADSPRAPRLARNDAPHQLDLRWLLKKLGSENVTSLLVEGGGEVNASFLLGGFAQRVAFFYAPKILGGRDSLKAVAGEGAKF